MLRKKFFIIIVILAITLTTAAAFMACSSPCNVPVENVSIVIIGANGETIVEIEARNYSVNCVHLILQQNNDVLQIPQSQLNGGFITIIYGIEAIWGEEGSQYWWVFEIDGEMSPVGIRDARVNDNAVISFTLVEGF